MLKDIENIINFLIKDYDKNSKIRIFIDRYKSSLELVNNLKNRFLNYDDSDYLPYNKDKYDIIISTDWDTKSLIFKNKNDIKGIDIKKEKKSLGGRYTGYRIERSLGVIPYLKNLSENGVAIMFTPCRFFFPKYIKEESYEKIPFYVAVHKYLIEHRLISSIISFPPNLLEWTGAPFYIMVLKKNCKDMQLINITSSDVIKGGRTYKLKLFNILKVLETRYELECFSKIIKYNDYKDKFLSFEDLLESPEVKWIRENIEKLKKNFPDQYHELEKIYDKLSFNQSKLLSSLLLRGVYE